MLKKLLRFNALLVAVSLLLSASADKAYSQQHGFITSRPCPYSCRTQNIDKRLCRDWREGAMCFIEDRSKAANTPAPDAPKPPSNPPQANNPGVTYWGGSNPNLNPSLTHGEDQSECRRAGRVAAPRVTVYKTNQTGNIFGNKIKVRGSIEGVCLADAGYFESGQKKQTIPITTTRDFRRYEFEVVARSTENPEIRVYNTNGDLDYAQLGTGNGW